MNFISLATATVLSALIQIHDIQGTAHRSPMDGQLVKDVPGIVTAVRSQGFYVQDPTPDTNDATSEGIFVFTTAAPTVAIGDAVSVNGKVSEFQPGGMNRASNLTITQIVDATITKVSSGNPLPAAVVLGRGGRAIPNRVISDDAVGGSVENAGTVFDPQDDGIDFYESLEGMQVQVNRAIAVSPTIAAGEIAVLADQGANAGIRTSRGGIVIRPTDFNPERIMIDDAITKKPPKVNVGDQFEGAIVGVIDYGFGNFKLQNTQPLSLVKSGNLQREVTDLSPTNNGLTIATFNVENLDLSDGSTKFKNLANRIVNNLKSPDIISLEEVQDNNGAIKDTVVDASQTYEALISAISAEQNAQGVAEETAYQYRQIDPVADQDGGEPGGNIRVGFLFNPNRVQFVDRPGGSSTSGVTVNSVGGVPQLSASPGRIDPANAAFRGSRKPLVGEFLFKGQTIFVIATHFNSKGGDQPLFGRFQPPKRSSETRRMEQATAVKDFVQQLLAAGTGRNLGGAANVVVMGDFNDFEFSDSLKIFKRAGLMNLTETLPQRDRYTYVYQGNSQALDHILVSPKLGKAPILDGFDVVHINAEFTKQDSDHDPNVARFIFADS
ncbi:endonuclease/exonuclease/phosphatase family protein [Myxacorys almedinensis]|uniref:Endonuclease/exonuclease/phosphatase domain-containing protein n=1 Tax=Myxacorys almedinensis A TaxID=2690445 RepID=A0A8J7Z2G9_9CYAN|nr:endonuclease/exonuclease/phosphatase family protein [Myxacorys almedinensis]NDJ18070.1 hypothetical protein [Myxacorys almedinensis A]